MKRTLSILLLVIVNTMFTYKYLSREMDYALAVTIGIAVIQVLAFYFVPKYTLSSINFKWLAWLSILGIIGLIFVAHFKVPLDTLNVDRWSVIDSFWSSYFSGRYPYEASSHMGNPPGSMPMYFVMALPFWAIGELSILSAIGYVVLITLLMRKKEFKQSRYAVLIYLLTAVFLVWEVLVRSNIITNTMLVLLVLDLFLKADIKNLKKNWYVAVLLGLMLATRGNFAVVYVIFFMFPLLKKEVSFLQLFKFTALSAFVFASVFLILIGIYGDLFFEANPFIFHSTLFVPTAYIVAFFVIAFVFSFLSKNKADLFFFSGITLFAIILLYAINLILVYGFHEAYMGKSWIDISYFLFCVPFLFWYILLPKSSKILSN